MPTPPPRHPLPTPAQVKWSCPAGQYCQVNGQQFLGVTRICPAGTYGGTTQTGGACLLCPESTPYSRSGATVVTECGSCAVTSRCTELAGRYACPSSDWTVVLGDTGVERNHSCVKYFSTPQVGFDASASACEDAGSVGKPVHLLTTGQV
jgi:hypothetical protein